MTLAPGDRVYDPLSERYGVLVSRNRAVGLILFDDARISHCYLGGVMPARPMAYAPPRLVARDGVRVEGV